MAERKEIDGIKHVGLPYPIGTDETIKLRREAERCLPDVLIVQYRQPLKNHSYLFSDTFDCKITAFKAQKRKKFEINFNMCDKLRNFAPHLRQIAPNSKASYREILKKQENNGRTKEETECHSYGRVTQPERGIFPQVQERYHRLRGSSRDHRRLRSMVQFILSRQADNGQHGNGQGPGPVPEPDV
jgi:hypothetical protein